MFDPNRYDGRMPYRRCGKSGLLLPAISLGLWHNFGHDDDFETARRTIHRAFDRGITHFDLANNYGPPPGSAEENFGRIMVGDLVCHRDEILISTKAGHEMWSGPYGMNGSRKHMLASLDQSLRRMKLSYVDIFYSHCHDPHTPLEETMGALATAVTSGKALYAGISKYPLKQLKKAVAILADLGVPCSIYQPPYSMLRRDFETDGTLKWLRKEGIGAVVFSPLAQGQLTGKYLEGKLPAESRALRGGFLTPEQVSENIGLLGQLSDLAQANGTSLHHLAIQWVLRKSTVASAIIGARTPEQLDDSLAALQAPPVDSSMEAAIDGILNHIAEAQAPEENQEDEDSEQEK